MEVDFTGHLDAAVDIPANHDVSPCRSAEEAAALFLLTFKEQYKLPQRAINFAVGSISTILQSVCGTIQSCLQELVLA